jgi:hypothetical protein
MPRSGEEDADFDNALPPFEVKSFVWKKGAFKGDLTLHQGRSNHCSVKGDSVFHLYLDCDDAKLRKIFDGILLLRKRFPELSRVKFYIVNSSLNRFSIVAFARMSWKRHLEIMWYAVEVGLEHYGHAFYSTRKGYAVLRTGAKDGIAPRILFELGETVVCKTCMREFVESIE